MPRRAHRGSLAAAAALGYTVLVLYASLYPFTGWRWPPGMALPTLLVLPWPRWRDAFDEWSNLAGYLPLGLLVAQVALRAGRGRTAAFLLGAAAPALLSYGCEVLQQFVPTRHPSAKDWALNGAGAAAGAALALALHGLGLADAWRRRREQWFGAGGTGALALLALWPAALLFPTPAPFGVGHLHEPLRALLVDWLTGVPWAQAAHALLDGAPARDAPLTPAAEAAITTLGLVAPCLLAYATVQAAARRIALGAALLFVAAAAMTLATLLNFGPAHAFAWIGRTTAAAFAAAALLALALAPAARALVVGCGLVALGALVAAVVQAPADPYFAQTLQAWEQGRFVRFHGLAQWVGWLWPYAAIGWFLAQLGRSR